MKEYDFSVFSNYRKRDRDEIERAKKLGGCETDILDVHLQEVFLEEHEKANKAFRKHLSVLREKLIEQHKKVLQALKEDFTHSQAQLEQIEKEIEEENEDKNSSPSKMPKPGI